MDLTGSAGDAPDGWSLDDIKRYLTLQRFLPKNSGLFGSGWARFMANQEDAGAGATPSNSMPNTLQKPVALAPWIAPTVPSSPVDLSSLSQLLLNGSAAPKAGPGGFDVFDPVNMGLRPPSNVVAGAIPPRGAVNNLTQVSAPSGAGPATRATSATKAPPPIDPSKTDVFQRGPDGKLHPIPGWRTTGPFDFGTWSHNIDWDGVGRDLTNIGIAATTIMGSGAPAALEALDLGDIFGPALKGVVHGHHVDPRFMGGRAAQETYDLIAQFHSKFHVNLQRALKEAGFPPVGSKAGSREVWAQFFKDYPGARDKAVEILRQVSRDFDIERGTSILPSLEKELRIAKPTTRVPPPSK